MEGGAVPLPLGTQRQCCQLGVLQHLVRTKPAYKLLVLKNGSVGSKKALAFVAVRIWDELIEIATRDQNKWHLYFAAGIAEVHNMRSMQEDLDAWEGMQFRVWLERDIGEIQESIIAYKRLAGEAWATAVDLI